MTHTNFRIDNILPTTRYTELPEQAKKELDELDQYIHGESHRCDYLVKHVIPKQHESIKQAKHDQEMLSYVRMGGRNQKWKWILMIDLLFCFCFFIYIIEIRFFVK